MPPLLCFFLLSWTLLLVSCAKQAGASGLDTNSDLILKADATALRECVVHLRWGPEGAKRNASAVWLPDGRLLTCRHALPEFVFWKDVVVGTKQTAGRFSFVAEVNGRVVELQVVDSGPTDQEEDDWAVLALTDATVPRCDVPLQPDAVLRKGDQLVVVSGPHLSVLLPAEVCGTPLPGLPMPARTIAVRLPSPDLYRGVSGSGAFVWNSEQNEWRLIGIYRGTREWAFLGVKVSVQCIVRLPQHLTK